MPARRLTRVTGLLCAGALLVAGCSSGGGKTDTSQPRIKASGGGIGNDHHEDATQVCRLVTQQDAAKLFGAPANRNTDSSLEQATGACIWNGTKGSQNDTLQAHVFDSLTGYNPKKVLGSSTVNGVGDRAYAFSLGTLGYQVWFVKGPRVGTLNFTVGSSDNAVPRPAAAHAAAVIALARKMAAQM